MTIRDIIIHLSRLRPDNGTGASLSVPWSPENEAELRELGATDRPLSPEYPDQVLHLSLDMFGVAVWCIRFERQAA